MAISPLGHGRAGSGAASGTNGASHGNSNGAVSRATRARIALVEDRLTGDRRNLPAPPSHRSPTARADRDQPRNPNQPRDLDQTAPLPAGLAGPGNGTNNRTGLSPLTASATSIAVAEDPTDLLPAGTLSPIATLTEADQDVIQDTEVNDPYQDPTVGRLSLSRRIVRGGLVVGLIAAAGAIMFAVPDENAGATVETASADEAVPIPATAEMLDNTSLDSVDVSLGASDSLNSIATSAFASRAGSPADTPAGFDAAVAEVVDEATAPSTTTTTAWVEPPLPPESEWVDTGNGVLVPDVLLRIRFCESTNNYAAANTGSSARGAYQFLTKSWGWYGHAEITGIEQAHLATAAQQDEAALRTLQSEGTGPWAESRPCWSSADIAPNYATAAPPTPATTVPADPNGDTTVPEGETTTTEDGSSDATTPDTETTVDGSDTSVEDTTATTVADGGDPTTTTTTQP